MGLVGDIAAGAIAFVLLTAGVWKLRHAGEAGAAWEQHGILPQAVVRLAAVVVGPIEMLLGAGLVVPGTRSVAAGAAGVLFVVYGLYLLVAQRRKTSGGCGCFATDSAERVNLGHVFRVALFGGLAAFAALTASREPGLAALAVGGALGGALVAVGSLVTTLLDVSARRPGQRVAA